MATAQAALLYVQAVAVEHILIPGCHQAEPVQRLATLQQALTV
jgi:hypothetical protein